jgi:hypothetical protein
MRELNTREQFQVSTTQSIISAKNQPNLTGPKLPLSIQWDFIRRFFRTNDDYSDDSGANLRLPKVNQVSSGALLRFIKSSWFLIGNIQRPIHACLRQEMSHGHYPKNVFCAPWWHQISLEPLISEYSWTSESIVSFSRKNHSSATAGNDHFC